MTCGSASIRAVDGLGSLTADPFAARRFLGGQLQNTLEQRVVRRPGGAGPDPSDEAAGAAPVNQGPYMLGANFTLADLPVIWFSPRLYENQRIRHWRPGRSC
jgi:glutathione S-transferase